MNPAHVMDAYPALFCGGLPTAKERSGQDSRTKSAANSGWSNQGCAVIDSEDIEPRLINWGRWCRQSSTPGGGHCGSIEWRWVGRWKEKYGWEDQPDVTKILDRVDVLDAERVQSIMIHLPLTYRQVLSMKYVHRENPKRMAYKSGCREWALESLISEAKHAANICLTGLKKTG